MELRLVEQACGCFALLRGGGGLKLSWPSPASGTRVESACRRDRASAGQVFAFAVEPLQLCQSARRRRM